MRVRLAYLVFTLVLISSFSCKKIVSALFGGTEFNVPDMQVTVPALPFVSSDEVEFGSITQNINLDSVVKANTANQFSADVVSSVNIKTITITVNNADNLNDLSNFESGRITLTSNTNSTPTNLATITFPTSSTTTYVYTPTANAELISYLKGSTLTYKIYGKNRKITTKPLNLTVSVRLKVN